MAPFVSLGCVARSAFVRHLRRRPCHDRFHDVATFREVVAPV